MIDPRAARRYARALFNTASQQGIVKSVEDDLNLVVTVTRGAQGFKQFIESPSATDADKLGLFERTFSDRVTATTMAFLRLLLDKGREDNLDMVRIAFTELRRDHEGIVHADITTTIDLTEDERRKIIDRLTRVTGKTIEPAFHVDPALIGGIRVALGDTVLEGSVKGALNRLRDRLIYDLLKQH